MATWLITGATGFVGGHLAEAYYTQRGIAVRTLARPNSDTALLHRLGATIITGDLTDAAAVAESVRGADVVAHCAAKVGDWGPVEDYRAVNVEATRLLLEACRGKPLQRFVHLSSLGVNESRHHHGTDETAALPEQHIDGYTQTKTEAERFVLSYHRDHGVPVTVLRPGFIYGPRDRTVLPSLIDNLKRRQVRYIGFKATHFNTIYVGNLVDAIFLAAEKPAALGQVYNLTDGEPVTRRRFIGTLAKGVGAPKPPPVPLPLWMARMMVWWYEDAARRRGDPKPPLLTQARLKFMGLNLDFSIDKARRELGYAPRTDFETGMAQTVAWLKQNA